MMQAQVGMVPPMNQRMMPWCANVHHKGHGCNLRLPILIFSIFFFFYSQPCFLCNVENLIWEVYSCLL
jgi:hypothetical protein